MLLKVNEKGRWSDPPPEDPVKRAQQDEEIFQTARLVNCGHFMALIFGLLLFCRASELVY